MVEERAGRLFDPICGMWLAPDEVAATYTYIGRSYSFCSDECRDLFARKPDVYVVELAYDPEACIVHRCPRQRVDSPERLAPPSG